MCKLTKLQVIDNKIIALNEERVAFVFEKCKTQRKIFILQHIKVLSVTTLLKHIITIEYRLQCVLNTIFFHNISFFCFTNFAIT